MASGYHGNGFAPVGPSSLIKQRPQRDPNWELSEASTEQTSVITERVNSRVLSAAGFIVPRSLTDIQRVKQPLSELNTWGKTDDESKEVTLDFVFQNIDLQGCYGIEVEGAFLSGLNVNQNPVRIRTASSELCADAVDDDLSTRFSRCQFSAESGGTISFREVNTGVVHTTSLFSTYGLDNGFYTMSMLIEAVKTRVKSFLDSKFSPETVNVEFFIDNVSGKLVLAWELPPAIQNLVGYLEMDVNPESSTILKYLYEYFMYDNFKRGAYTYDTITKGDGIAFTRTVNDFMDSRAGGGNLAGNVISNTPLFVLVSPELTQFEKQDSINQITTSGEIGTVIPIRFGANNCIGGTKQNGTLFSPKIPFDPNYSLQEFTVKVVGAGDNGLMLNAFLNAVFHQAGVVAPGDDIELMAKRLSLLLIARIY